MDPVLRQRRRTCGAGQGVRLDVVPDQRRLVACVPVTPRTCVRGRCRQVSKQADDMADCEQRRRLIALAGIALVLRISEKRKREDEDGAKTRVKRTHRWWVRPWIVDKNLPECNTVYKLQLELEKVGR